MGKRKRTSAATKYPSSSDNMPCSSGAELLSNKGSSNLPDSVKLKPLSSGMDVTDSSVKLLDEPSSLARQHCNIGHSVFLKRSRHFYGHQYSRRGLGNHSNASTSHRKIALEHDERLPFMLISRSGSEFERSSESWEKAFGGPNRIRYSSSVMDASNAVKMVCGICEKQLRRKPFFLGDSLSSGEYSIVAVLVCGHVYHADCLEHKTSLDDIRDPPCPLCLGLLSEVGAFNEKEE